MIARRPEIPAPGAALLLLALALLFPTLAHAQEADESVFSTPVDPSTRYEILSLPQGKELVTFRFDRSCGNLESLNLEGRAPAWQPLTVPGLPVCTVDGRSHYQLFYTGKTHAYLLNTDLKATWDLDLGTLTLTQM